LLIIVQVNFATLTFDASLVHNIFSQLYN